MKKKLFFILAFVLGTMAVSAQEYWINENFTSTEWQNVMKNYVDDWNADPGNASNQKTYHPVSGNENANNNFAINTPVTSPKGVTIGCSNCQYYYSGKKDANDGYTAGGEILPSTEDDITSQYLLRLNNTKNVNANIELPQLENVGKIILYTRNRNNTSSTMVILEKYDEKEDSWKPLETQIIPPYTDVDGEGNSMSYIDMAITFDFYSEVPVKLRFAKDYEENRFINFYKLKVEKYDAGNYWINDNFTSAAWQNVMKNYATENTKTFPVGPANGNFTIEDDIIASPGGRNFVFYNCQYFYYSTSEVRDGYASSGTLLPSIDGDITVPYLVRTNNAAGTDASIELPPLDDVGKIILHVRNRNTTDASNIILQKYDDVAEEWKIVETKVIAPYANIDGEDNAMTTIDHVISYDFYSASPVKLRISKDNAENRYISFYKIMIEKHNGSGLFIQATDKNEANVSVSGKTILIYGDVIYSDFHLYDLTGKKVFQLNNAGQQVLLPESLDNGIYILKLSDENKSSLVKKVYLR